MEFSNEKWNKNVNLEELASVPSEAACCEIGPALWKIGSLEFVKICEKDVCSC